MVMTNNYIHIHDGFVDVCLDVLIRKDKDDVYLSYAPALDLSGCGHSVEEAKKSLETVLTEYLKFTIANGTLEQDLLEHKWKKQEKKYSSPAFWVIFRTNKVAQEMYAGDFSKSQERITIAC